MGILDRKGSCLQGLLIHKREKPSLSQRLHAHGPKLDSSCISTQGGFKPCEMETQEREAKTRKNFTCLHRVISDRDLPLQ